MLLVHLFVCFVRVSFLSFFLPLGIGDWLRFVALPGLYYYYFLLYGHNDKTNGRASDYINNLKLVSDFIDVCPDITGVDWLCRLSLFIWF